VEACDSLQCFLLFHSIGGGTGSGVGSYLVGLLDDNYHNIFRFTGSVFPSKEDDVVVSPYNSLLSLNQLIEHADCVFPIDNQALINICKTIETPIRGKGTVEKTGTEDSVVKGSTILETGEPKKKEKPYEKMNNIIAHLFSNLTWYALY
jgi:Tubulin